MLPRSKRMCATRCGAILMNKRSSFDAGLLCTVGAGIFAVGVSQNQISRVVHFPNVAFVIFMVIGGALVVAGAIRFMLSIVMDRIDQIVSVYLGLDAKYLCTQAQHSDLAGLFDLYTRYFGADVPDIELMSAWITKCASAFTLVQKVIGESGLSTRQELVGSFKILPLTKKGVNAIELGQTTGSTFRPEHISGSRSRPVAYYVGDVVATTRFARAVVMAQLNAAISPVVRGPMTVYARPLTKDGLRVIDKTRIHSSC